MSSHTPLRLLLAVLGAALLVVPAASVAAAAPVEKPAPAAVAVPAGPVTNAPSGCRAGNLCFWADTYYVDGPGQLSGPNRYWTDFAHASCATKGTTGANWANCASSIYNNGVNCTAHVYFLANYGGPKLNIARGVGYVNLATVAAPGGDNWNDNIMSNNWC